jgi:1,4-dihydroxy-2-naphthoyl-CoA hydrolase
MAPMPTINRRILLDDCDAAGVVFGPHLATLAHHAYEEALADAGIDLAAVGRGGDLALPYVHLDCEFRAPLRHGDLAALTVTCGRVGNSSYTVHVDIAVGETSCAKVSQTHVAIDPRTRGKIELPAALRQALGALTVCPS